MHRRLIFLVFQELFHNFAKSYWNDYSKIRRASIPKWMPAFVLTDYRGEVLVRGANCSTTIVYLIHYDNKNRLQTRDSFHQGGDCQACQNQGVQTQEIRQD